MCLMCGDRDLVHRSALLALLSSLLRPTRVAPAERSPDSDSGFGSPATASPGAAAGAALGGGGSGALVFRGAVLCAGASRVLPVELRVFAWHELLRRALVALIAPAPSSSSAVTTASSTNAHALDWQCAGAPFDGVILVSCAERPASAAVVRYILYLYECGCARDSDSLSLIAAIIASAWRSMAVPFQILAPN